MSTRVLPLLLALLPAAPAAAADRPNVVFLMADDHRADAIAALGHPAVHTPNLDGLVRRGFTFRNAYCLGSNSGAVCTPSRNMFLSGRAYFRWKGSLAPADGPNFPAAMKAAGYETYHHGKRGNTATAIQATFEHNRYVNENATRASGEPAREIADAAIGFLDSRDRSRPFFLYLGFETPHDPRVGPKRHLDRYDAAKLPLPANFLPAHPFDNGEMLVRDELLLPWPRTADAVRKELRDYYGCVSALDEQVGRFLAALAAKGLSDNTVIVYSSDHGLALGSHGLLGKQSVYEHSLKSPLIFAGPGIPHGSSDAFAYLFDIFPTVCELTGAKPPADLDGKSLAPVVAGNAAGVRDAVFLAYRDVQRAVRVGGWKLIRYPQVHHDQLFDLTADPYETTNLAADPAQAARLADLRARLTASQRQYGDTLPLTAVNQKPLAFTPPTGDELDKLRGRRKPKP